jgi:hypothetical protein
MRALHFLGTSLTALVLVACGNTASPTTTTPSAATADMTPVTAATNELSMRVDGVEWRADHEVFGAFHPPGYERALLMAGARGRKDANEQAMNINLFGIDGPGRYTITTGHAAGSVAQLANYTPERFLAGSMMGYELVIDVKVAQADPTHIEATFSGTLTGNDSVVMKIEDGRFVYRD